MTLKDAIKNAKEEAATGVVQHVCKNKRGEYYVSDWYDEDETIISFEGKRTFNNKLTPEEKKMISEIYIGSRNFESEKSAVEYHIKKNEFKNSPYLMLKYKQFSEPFQSNWEKFTPEWNIKKPSIDHNPTILYSYKIASNSDKKKEDIDPKYLLVYFWLDKKQYNTKNKSEIKLRKLIQTEIKKILKEDKTDIELKVKHYLSKVNNKKLEAGRWASLKSMAIKYNNDIQNMNTKTKNSYNNSVKSWAKNLNVSDVDLKLYLDTILTKEPKKTTESDIKYGIITWDNPYPRKYDSGRTNDDYVWIYRYDGESIDDFKKRAKIIYGQGPKSFIDWVKNPKYVKYFSDQDKFVTAYKKLTGKTANIEKID